jgi:hypothetical protein
MAGRDEEAWNEYNRLLVSDPTRAGSRELTPMFHSQIYDKMRLFLQRQGRADQAVGFGALSALSWAIALHHQGRKSELREMHEDANLDRVIRPLVRKAKRPDSVTAVKAILRQALQAVPNTDLQELLNDISRTLADPAAGIVEAD